jgi:hypothetical protein
MMENVENINLHLYKNTEGAIKDGQYRETGNIGYTRQRQINVREYRRDNKKWTTQSNW